NSPLQGGARTRVRLAVVAGSALVVAVCLGVVFLGLRILSTKVNSSEARSHAAGQADGVGGPPGLEERGNPAGSHEAAGTSSPQLPDGEGDSQGAASPRFPSEKPGHGQKRFYRQMTDAEQAHYVEQQARHVADMIGKRPCTFTPEVLNLIKYWVDAYSRRVGNNQAGLWREDLRTVFKRATRYTPIIIREFRRRDINEV